MNLEGKYWVAFVALYALMAAFVSKANGEVPSASPTPYPSQSPGPSPTPSPTPVPSPSASPAPTPTPTSSVIPILETLAGSYRVESYAPGATLTIQEDGTVVLFVPSRVINEEGAIAPDRHWSGTLNVTDGPLDIEGFPISDWRLIPTFDSAGNLVSLQLQQRKYDGYSEAIQLEGFPDQSPEIIYTDVSHELGVFE
jgi:hypothetical protein